MKGETCAAKGGEPSLLWDDIETRVLQLCVISDIRGWAERESGEGVGESDKDIRDYGGYDGSGCDCWRWFDRR